MGGHLPELEPGMIADPFLRKTFVKSWEPEKQAGWGAEISGNYYAGLIQLAYTLDDEELKSKATAWVDAFLKMQQPDGYLGTYTGPDANIYEGYNALGTARGMRALLFYYEATGREDVFNAVYRCMLWFARTWAGDRKTTYAAPVILEPVLYCYHKTGDAALLKFAQEYMEFLCTHTTFDNSYPWEEPYIRLHVPAYRAPMYSAPYPIATFEPLEDRLAVTTPLELTLVPYGATSLRITYFPRADLEAAGTP